MTYLSMLRAYLSLRVTVLSTVQIQTFLLQVYLVAHTETASSRLWITKDSGLSFQQVNLTFMLDGELTFHPKPSHANWVLALSDIEQVPVVTVDACVPQT